MGKHYDDFFGLICEDRLGEGEYRSVYSCRVNPDIVIKVERDRDWRSFANVKEHAVWWEWRDKPSVARWLAPCTQLSPDGRFLLQRRAQPLPPAFQLPSALPGFLADLKPSNFGLLDGELVCVDYAFVNMSLPTRLRNVEWNT